MQRFRLPSGLPDKVQPAEAYPKMPAQKPASKPVVGIIMGSRSDWPTLQMAAEILGDLGVPYETRIVSAHRTPDRLYAYAKAAKSRGLKTIIAGAGGAAHLPGMTASMTVLPVLGVPVETRSLKGLDSLLSIAQMPGGIPVATFAIGQAGAKNAGLFAAALLALEDPKLARRLETWRGKQTRSVANAPDDKKPKKRKP
jgi:5-(carboxyamino)imidazole ribonucleotide mutase